MTAPSDHKFMVLDAMRGVAAISVLLFHFRPFISIEHAFPSGYLAVDLFFVLSGFVVAHAYDRKIAAGMRSSEFIKIRLIRFLPLLWLGVAIGAAALMYRLAHGATGFTKRDVVLATIHNALLLPTNFGRDNLLFPTNWPEWSLFVELVANVLYVCAFRHLGLRTLCTIAGLSACFIVVVVIKFQTVNTGPFIFDIYAGLIRVLFSFFVGLLIYRSRERWMSRMPGVSPVALLALLTLLLLVPASGVPRMGYDLVFVLLLSPLLVMSGSVVQPGIRLTPVAVWLGVVSYPIYAIHDPIFDWTTALISASTPYRGVCVAVLISAIVAVAWPLERHYHRRVGGWLRQLVGARQGGSEVSVTRTEAGSASLNPMAGQGRG